MWHHLAELPSDPINGLPSGFDNSYQRIRDWGYNVLRIPVAWNNLEPVAPVWNAALNQVRPLVEPELPQRPQVDRDQGQGSRALGDPGHASGLLVARASPHHPVERSSRPLRGSRSAWWFDPTMDAKATTPQAVDYFDGMNWFFRNVHDPAAKVTHATPWQLFSSAWARLPARSRQRRDSLP